MNQEENFKEKRLFKRYSCHLGGDYLSSDNEGSRGIGRVKDISTRGAGLIIAGPLTPGINLEVRVTDKNTYPLTLRGKVRWCKKISGRWRAGILFDKPLFFPLRTIV